MSKISITPNASGTGVFTISSPATNTDRTLTLPDEAGTIITTAGVPSSAMPAGSVLQVVYGTYSTQLNLSSTSYVDSGLSLSITPQSITSKIYVIVNQQVRLFQTSNTDIGVGLRLMRDATAVFSPVTSYDNYLLAFPSSDHRYRIPLNYLDSPATTSAVIYKTQASGYYPVNGAIVLQDNANPSNITLMEIAG